MLTKRPRKRRKMTPEIRARRLRQAEARKKILQADLLGKIAGRRHRAMRKIAKLLENQD